jgi:hypothetical protein
MRAPVGKPIMSFGPRRFAAALSMLGIAFATGACSGLDCPKGYDLRGETCYRIRDAGVDGGDAAVEQPEGQDAALDGASIEPIATAPGSCGDGCGAHASCDTESRTCECDPGYIETNAGCVRDRCAQDQACDEPCNRDADCTEKTCQTKICDSGRCVYTELTPGQSGNCASGLVCTASLECKECISDEQCDRLDGMCADGICDASSNTCEAKPKTGACGSLKICSSGSCENSCGNGVVDSLAEEECDPNAAEAGWDDWSCNSETCRRTGLLSSTSYHRCGGDAACTPNETCKPTPAIPWMSLCIPKCFWGVCPFPPGYTAYIDQSARTLCDDAMGHECWIKCASNEDCPPSLTCMGSMCANYD